MSNQTAKLTIEFSGDLADSLRAIANLVDEHGPAFLSDPTAFFSIFNDGAVHRVDVDVSETAPLRDGEYISPADATHFRVFEDFDGWAIDAANGNNNYSGNTWTHWDGEPLTKEMAIEKVPEFAKEYGRPDIADKYIVVEPAPVDPSQVW